MHRYRQQEVEAAAYFILGRQGTYPSRIVTLDSLTAGGCWASGTVGLLRLKFDFYFPQKNVGLEF